MKIAIVVDMWLTGFDVPSLATMYVYKPMKDHNLMQAIARVNRVFPDFQHGSPAERARLIKGAVNHMIAPDKAIDCKDFIKNASLLRQAVTLCRSLLIGEERFEVGFMESVRTLIVRLQRPGKVTKREINQRIAALIEQSVTSDGVVNLFDEQSEFSLFDEKFMEEVRKMKEKNLAV